MCSEKVYDVPKEVAARAHITADKYKEMYARSVSDPDGFWGEQAEKFISWFKKWDKVQEWDFKAGAIRFFEGGKLNASYNCIDRHLETRGDQVAILWEGDDPSVDKAITFRELLEQVSKFANGLKSRG